MVTCQGTRYSKGMIVTYGSTAGLPDFAEIIQMALLGEWVPFIVRRQISCSTSASSVERHLSVCSVFQDMERTVRFLIDHEVKKLNLNSGIPSTVDELVAAVKENISIPTDIKLQYKDEDFDDFFTPAFTSEVKDKDTLKVVQAPLSLILTAVPQEDTLEASYLSSLCESVNLSVDSWDTESFPFWKAEPVACCVSHSNFLYNWRRCEVVVQNSRIDGLLFSNHSR